MTTLGSRTVGADMRAPGSIPGRDPFEFVPTVHGSVLGVRFGKPTRPFPWHGMGTGRGQTTSSHAGRLDCRLVLIRVGRSQDRATVGLESHAALIPLSVLWGRA